MLHMRLGEDAEWALVRSRERLDHTDPPLGPLDRGRGLIARRTVLAVACALAITAILHADTAPSSSAAPAGPGAPGGPTAGGGSPRPHAAALGPAVPWPPRGIVHRAIGRTHRMQRTAR